MSKIDEFNITMQNIDTFETTLKLRKIYKSEFKLNITAEFFSIDVKDGSNVLCRFSEKLDDQSSKLCKEILTSAIPEFLKKLKNLRAKEAEEEAKKILENLCNQTS